MYGITCGPSCSEAVLGLPEQVVYWGLHFIEKKLSVHFTKGVLQGDGTVILLEGRISFLECTDDLVSLAAGFIDGLHYNARS
jgi:hypothetical protein